MRLFGRKREQELADAAARATAVLRVELEAEHAAEVERVRKETQAGALRVAAAAAIEAAKPLQTNQYLSPLGTGPRPAMYAIDTPSLYSQHHSTRTRPKSRIDLETLRRVASSYDVLRSCIEHLKREVSAVPGRIGPRDSEDKSEGTTARVKEMTEWFNAADLGLGGVGKEREHFENEIIEDALVIGAYAAYIHPTLGGMPAEVCAIDSMTIRPKVDGYGWQNPEDAYEQQVMGVVVRASISMDELIYDGIHPVSYSPYFVSPVEWLIGVIMSAVKADEWNRTWLTDGDTPDTIYNLPDDYTPDQVEAFMALFQVMKAGNSAERHKGVFIPGNGGMKTQTRKDSDFQEFELWLMRRTCAIFGVQPASIGFAGEQYKVSQEGSMTQTTQFGAGKLLNLRKRLYDRLLRKLGHPDLQWMNVTEGEESPLDRSTRLAMSDWMTDNEKRALEGLPPVEGGDELPAARAAAQAEADREAKKGEAGAANREPSDSTKKRAEDLKRWEAKALRLLGAGMTTHEPSSSHGFSSEFIDDTTRAAIAGALTDATTAEEIRAAFAPYRGN